MIPAYVSAANAGAAQSAESAALLSLADEALAAKKLRHSDAEDVPTSPPRVQRRGADHFQLESLAGLVPVVRESAHYAIIERAVSSTTPIEIVEVYENPRPRTYDKSRFGFDDMTYLLGHCNRVGPEALLSIVNEGLRPGTCGRLGPGIYLSDDLAKCLGYGFVSPEGLSALVLAQTNLGQSYTPTRDEPHLNSTMQKLQGRASVFVSSSNTPTEPMEMTWPDGSRAMVAMGPFTYDSAGWSASFRHNEYVAWDGIQCFVRFVVVFRSDRAFSGRYGPAAAAFVPTAAAIAKPR